MARFSAANARYALLGVWAFFLVLNLALVFYLYLDNWVEEDNFKAALAKLNAVYVTYLGVMIVYIFTDKDKAGLEVRGAGAAFVVALVASLLWNLPISIFLFRVVMEADKIERAVRLIGDTSAYLAWAVGPAIGYYFAKS